MASTTTAREKLPAYEPTVAKLFFSRVQKTPNHEAFRTPTESGGWRSQTWKEIGEQVTVLGAGLLALGLQSEQRVGIASNTRTEWLIANLAANVVGGAVTTVYPSTGAEDVAFILSDSDSRFLFAENDAQVAKVRQERDQLPHLEKIILFDGKGDGDWVISLDDLKKLGADKLASDPDCVTKAGEAVKPEDLATLIYTSGTTGKPKGVELTNANWTYEGAAIDGLGVINQDDLQFLWLPMSHVFGSVLLAVQLQIGFATAVDGTVPKIVTNLPLIKPTFMAAVPRIFEKVYAGVANKAHHEGGSKAKIFDWAFATGKQGFDLEQQGKKPGPVLSAKLALADKLVFSKIREALGGQMRYMISGSAALSGDIAEWFYIAGMPILEGYGLTETTAGTSIMRPDRIKFGTVGEPVPGTEIRIADDGEILIKGGGVMRGYRNRPDANAEAFAVEGYFASGDIGEIDSMGRVKITDRKKDLVKTSGGKYIAPSAIESQFKAICGLAGNMVVHANNRKFASALITLDPDAAAQWAKSNGMDGAPMSAIAKDPAMVAEIQSDVDQLNAGLNRWETIKKFEILDHDFTVEDGELTPSLKVKRKVVEDKYRDILDAMYN